MAKTPIETLLDGVDWKSAGVEPKDDGSGLPYATHSGVLEIAGFRLRCFRLNTGQAVFEAEDFKQFMEGFASTDLTGGSSRAPG